MNKGTRRETIANLAISINDKACRTDSKRKRTFSTDYCPMQALKLKLRATDSRNTRTRSKTHQTYEVIDTSDTTLSLYTQPQIESDSVESIAKPVKMTNNHSTKTQQSQQNTTTNPMAMDSDPESFIDDHYNKICVGCDPTHVNNENKHVLKCESCSKLYCIQCVDISVEEHKFLRKRKLCHWYCPRCEAKVVNNIRVEAEIEDRCQAFLTRMEDRMGALEAQMVNKPDTEDVMKLIQTEMTAQIQPATEAQTREMIQEMVRAEVEKTTAGALTDRAARCNNLILYNLPESTGDDYKQRQLNDAESVHTLINTHIQAEVDSPDKVTRLGDRSDQDKPRPVKVEMKSEEEKRRVLRRAKKLKDAPAPFHRVSVSNDMSLEERDNNKKLLAEAKAMDARDTSGDWIHLVRGPPWDRQIVKLQRRRK